MAFVRTGSIARGEVSNAGSGPIAIGPGGFTSIEMDLKLLETLSLGCTYTQGGGSGISEFQFQAEASYDQGATWLTVAIGPTPAAPLDKPFEDLPLKRTVTTSDGWTFPDLQVSTFPRLRLVVTATGSEAPGDTLSIHAYSENVTGG